MHDILNKSNEAERQQKENLRRQPAGSASSPAGRRRFISPQADAERITDFNTQPTQSQGQFRHPPPLDGRSPAKRKRSDDPDAVSDDEGFTQDQREIDMSQRRRSAPRPQASPKRVRIDAPESSSRARQEIPERSTASQRRTSSQQRGSQNPEVQEYAEQKRILSSQAARAAPSSQRRTRPQGRVPWNDESEKALEDYVADEGISWAYIKKLDEDRDNLFEGRDQVALKDKARNMKTNMLM